VAPVAAVRATEAAPAAAGVPRPIAAPAVATSSAVQEGGEVSEALSTPRIADADTLRPSPINVATLAGAMASDAGRAALLTRVIQQDPSVEETLVEVARASATIGSPSQRARVLTDLAQQPQLDGLAISELLRATSGIDSDSDRRFALEALLRRSDLGPNQLVTLLGSAAEIGSSSERRFVLERFLDRFPVKEPLVRNAFFTAVRGIPSNTERRFLLEKVLDTQELCDDNLREVIASAAGLGSDSEKRFVLARVASRAPLTGKLRDAYLAAAHSISSDSERATALSALLGPTPPRKARESRTSGPSAGAQGQGVWNYTYEVVGEHHGKPSYELTLHAKNVVRGTDRGEVRDILPGGSLRVEHTIFPDNPDHGGRSSRRSVRGTPRAGGGVQWSYRVNGTERPWDAEGRAWLSALLRNHTK
ncbi:MAG: hypothetical protein M3409_04135, partial [Gemmatimonadota bacterium]|nr:hypothetical protein [Gemmatimonadota bacterium]